MIIDFPGGNIIDLAALHEYLKAVIGDVVVNITADVHGMLQLNDMQCDSLRIAGNGYRWSGAVPITVDMSLIGDNILVGKLPAEYEFDRLKCNGENMILARYPNSGGCSVSDIEKRAMSWNVERARVRALHEREWGGNSYRLFKEGDKIKLDWIGNNNRGSGYKEGSLVVENVFQELNSNKEWYYDNQSKKIYIYLDEAKSGAYNFELLSSLELINISQSNTAKINIDNINFCDTNSNMFNAPWQRYLRSDWAYNKSSAITIKGSRIVIDNCTFVNLGNNAIGIFDKSRDIVVTHSTFTDSLTNGILILGDPNSTYCTSAWDNNNHITAMEEPSKIGAKTDKYPSKIGISSCYFHNLGLEDKQCAAVCMSLSAYVTIANCTIHHMPRAGINIAENAFGGHVIQGNDIYDCVRETGDHGPFNSWGRDRYWSLKRFDTMGKYGKLKKQFALGDMIDSNTIDGNRICGAHGFGIDLDDGSSNYVITNNLCYGVGIKLREGFYRKVNNNLLINAPMDLHVSYCGNDDIICDNVIVNHKAFRIILPNSGNTTIIENNTIINNTVHLGKMVSRTKNKFIDNVDKSKLFDYYMGLMDKDYGVSTAPKPILDYDSQFISIKHARIGGARLSSMDDDKRSLSGAPDLNGIYIDRVSKFGRLAKFKLKKGDVIIAIDGNHSSWHDVDRLMRCKTLTVISNQIYTEKKLK